MIYFKKLIIVFISLTLCEFSYGKSSSSTKELFITSTTPATSIAFSSVPDSVQTSKGLLSKASIDKMIVDINDKIVKLQLQQKAADAKEKGLFGKLTEEISYNFREQKLSYLLGIKEFLQNQKLRLDDINQKVSKMID